MRLAGKIAIITGSGSGMGLTAARLFSREGASVVIAERNEESGTAAAAELVREGGRAIFVRTDVRHSADAVAMVKSTIEVFGGIDILYNNAGVEVPENDDGPADEALWDLMMETNPKGTWLCTKAALPYLMERRGSVLNTASVQWHGRDRRTRGLLRQQGGSGEPDPRAGSRVYRAWDAHQCDLSGPNHDPNHAEGLGVGGQPGAGTVAHAGNRPDQSFG
jgi:NAD(P)-dependent dehydrogenase (short-subunit alcohol dehydrogenase family)